MQDNQITVQELGEIKVTGENNAQIKLSALWQEQPAVIVFVRHFG